MIILRKSTSLALVFIFIALMIQVSFAEYSSSKVTESEIRNGITILKPSSNNEILSSENLQISVKMKEVYPVKVVVSKFNVNTLGLQKVNKYLNSLLRLAKKKAVIEYKIDKLEEGSEDSDDRNKIKKLRKTLSDVNSQIDDLDVAVEKLKSTEIYSKNLSNQTFPFFVKTLTSVSSGTYKIEIVGSDDENMIKRFIFNVVNQESFDVAGYLNDNIEDISNMDDN